MFTVRNMQNQNLNSIRTKYLIPHFIFVIIFYYRCDLPFRFTQFLRTILYTTTDTFSVRCLFKNRLRYIHRKLYKIHQRVFSPEILLIYTLR